MTTYTFTGTGTGTGTTAVDLGPALVSEVPAGAPARPSLLARFRDELAARRAVRQLDRALRSAADNEQGDLLALARRG